MFTDPIVQEVRDAREKIAEECEFDYHKIFLRGEEIAKQYKNLFKFVTKDELERIQQNSIPPQ
jgi:hypothetical protein